MHEEFNDYKRRFFDFGTLFEKTSFELNGLHQEFFKYYFIAQKTKFSDLKFPESANYKVDWMPFAIYFGLGKEHDYRQHLSRIKAHTFVIHGEFDLQPARVSNDYCRYIESCDFIQIGQASHFPFVENPVDFGESIALLLKETY